jgi:hypothetical protein
VTDSKSVRGPRSRYDAAGIETIRREWGPWCQALTPVGYDANAALAEVIDSLQLGIPADVVASRLRIRYGTQLAWDQGRLAAETAYCESVRKDVASL